MEFFEIPQIEGLSRKTSPFLLKEGQVTECQNVSFSKIGAATKTGDYEQEGDQITASQDILGMGMFTRDDGTYEHYALCDGSSTADIYKNQSGTWTAKSQSLTKTKRGYFVSMPELDFLFFANLSDDTRGYEGSSWSTSTNLTSAPKAQYLNVHDTRLFLGNANTGTSYPTRYYYSSSGTAGTISWNSSDFYTLPEPITGWANNREDQLCFTKHTMFRADAYDRKMIASVGAYSQDVVANIREYTLFADAMGNVHATNQAETQKISHAVQPYIDGISSLAAMRAASLGDDYYIYLGTVTLGGDTLTNVVLSYDIAQNKWGRLKTATTVKMMGNFIDSGVESIYFGNDNGEIFQLFEGGSQDGKDYTAFLEFPPVSPDGEINNYQIIDVWGGTLNGLSVQYKTEEGSRWQDVEGDLRGDYTRLAFNATGEHLYLRLAETGQDDRFEVYRIRVGYSHARTNI